MSHAQGRPRAYAMTDVRCPVQVPARTESKRKAKRRYLERGGSAEDGSNGEVSSEGGRQP